MSDIGIDLKCVYISDHIMIPIVFV